MLEFAQKSTTLVLPSKLWHPYLKNKQNLAIHDRDAIVTVPPRAEVARLRLHHVPGRVLGGQGARRPGTHSRRQADRPETCDPQVRSATGQDQEDIRRRSRTRHLGRGGSGLLLAVRSRRGRRHAHGSTDEASSGVRIRHLPFRGGSRTRM